MPSKITNIKNFRKCSGQQQKSYTTLDLILGFAERKKFGKLA